MILLIGILVALGIAFAVGKYLQRQPETSLNPAIVQNFNQRVQWWWILYAILGLTFLMGGSRIPAVVLFFVISFWALREFITLTPTRLGDHRALFSVFFIFTPLQYILLLVGLDKYPLPGGLTFDLDLLFMNLIPVYVFLYIPARIAVAGDHKRFLERVAKIQCGLLICVYSLSHAPALLGLKLRVDSGVWGGGPAGLLLFFIVVVQMSDVFQFGWSRLMGRRVIAPAINASRTWEGFFGGIISAAVLGAALYWVTPFSPPQAAGVSMLLALMGAAGSITMSAIKRDRGVSDYGTLVEGHVGVLDRFDSICFAAPVFYHVTRFLFS
jgi:phosphatidate cytidylyltransferase